MLPEPKGRRLKLERTSRTRSRSKANSSNDLSFTITRRLLTGDHSTRSKDVKRIRWPSTSDQSSSEPKPKRPVVPSHNPAITSTRSSSASAGLELSVANPKLPRGLAALLKATFILSGTPILISRKISSLSPPQQVHTLDIVSVEVFDSNKKNLLLKSTLIDTRAFSSERDRDYESSGSSLVAIRPVHRRESEEVAAQLLITLEHSLGNTATLPPCQEASQGPSRRVYMHYTDNEVSPEEKMAQMARYAYMPPAKTAPALATTGEKKCQEKEQFLLKLKRKSGVKVEFEDEQGGKTVKRVQRLMIEAEG